MVDITKPKQLSGGTKIVAFCLTAIVTALLLGAYLPTNNAPTAEKSTVHSTNVSYLQDKDKAEDQEKSDTKKEESTAKEEKGEEAKEKEGEKQDSKASDDKKDEKKDEADKKDKEQDILQQVDAAFGTYLKAPLEGVLFYPLYTTYDARRSLDKDGNKRYKHNDETDKDEEVVVNATVPFIVLWLLTGAVFFTLFMGFINFRGFKHAILLAFGKFDDPKDHGEVTHFQALTSALSGTVGLGNIAGVAIAVAQGGPGATFWIIVIGLLGMTTKFVECTLGQMYRDEDENGHVSGGPMRYLYKGLAEQGLGPFGAVLAVLFSVLCIGASFGGGNSFQVSQALGLIRTEVPVIDQHPWIFGLIMAVGIGVVIVGGIRWIGKATSFIVPFMCAGYIIMAFYVIGTNISAVPTAITRIFTEAFTWQAGFGGFLGVLVIGIQRAVFSNEAGAGSAAIAHSAAKTNIPVREGYVALLEPFIDTVVVCTITAIMIVVSGVMEQPASQPYIDSSQGAVLTKIAVDQTGMKIFTYFLVIAVGLFAYSTCISWFYYGERCFTNLFGTGSSIIFKILFLTFAFLGSIVTADNILGFSDALILGMSFPNLLGMYFLSGKVKAALNQYQEEFAAGKHQ